MTSEDDRMSYAEALTRMGNILNLAARALRENRAEPVELVDSLIVLGEVIDEIIVSLTSRLAVGADKSGKKH